METKSLIVTYIKADIVKDAVTDADVMKTQLYSTGICHLVCIFEKYKLYLLLEN